MARRKRLTAPNPDYLAPPLETGAMAPLGVAPTSIRRAPVAQVARDSAATAALEELSDTLHRAREEGRMVLRLPLGSVVADYLVRDRIRGDDEAMEALCASIAARGQQTPIEVTRLEGDRYGLISGWRRLTALKRLAAMQPGAEFDTVLALLRRPGDSAESYLAMVEENEIRVGLSHYERARIAMRAVETGVFSDPDDALLWLYASASRAKRSKIRSFLGLVAALDGALRFPEAIGERLGLKLAAALEADAALGPRLRGALESAAPQSAEAEKTCIETALRGPDEAHPAATESEELRPGVFLTRSRGDRIMLSGPGVTEALHRQLRDFLAGAG